MSARVRRPSSLLAVSSIALIAGLALACTAAAPDSDDTTEPDAAPAATGDPDAAPAPPPGGDPDASPGGSTPDAAPPTGALSPTQQALFDAINAERVAAGVAAVTIRDDLTCAAQAHSNDIGEAETCAVVGTDGSTIADRVVACSGPSVAGALVGCGYLSGSATAAGWSDDAGTRAILLDPALHFVGVGEHDRYWTAVFDR